jgi:hypothetical protein
MIQAIVCSFVPMSGAGTSRSGPNHSIANHPAFGASKRNVYNRTLPGHPTGQRPHLVQGYVWCKSNAALARPADDRMMHSVAYEHLEVPAIEHHRNVDCDFLVGIFQEAVQALFEP